MAWTDSGGGWTVTPKRATKLPLQTTIKAPIGLNTIGSPVGAAPAPKPPATVPVPGTRTEPKPAATVPTPGVRTEPAALPSSANGPSVAVAGTAAAAGSRSDGRLPDGTYPVAGSTTPPARRTFALDDYLTPFGPGNDLQSTQINPQASERVQDLRNRAAGLVNNQPTFTAINPETSARATRYAGMTDASAAELASGPDRQQLALQAFRRLLEETNPQYQQELRQVGDAAAAYGRIGSGMTTNDLGTVAQRRNETLTRAQQALADEAAGLTLSDRATRTSALAGLEGTARGYDAADRSEARGERGAAQDAFQRSLANYTGLADTFARDEANARDELRTERGFQTGQEQTAFSRAMQQAQFNADQQYRKAQLGLQDSQIQSGQANAAAGGVADLFKQIALGERNGDAATVQRAVDALRAAGLTDQQIVDQVNAGGDLG